MIGETINRIVEGISDLDSFDEIHFALIFKFFTLVTGLGRTRAVTTNENPVRKGHQVFEKQKWCKTVIIDAMGESQIKGAVFLSVGIMKIIHDYIHVVPL